MTDPEPFAGTLEEPTPIYDAVLAAVEQHDEGEESP